MSNRVVAPTVYTPVRGPYCPLMRAARVGWQFGPHVYADVNRIPPFASLSMFGVS